MVAFFLPCRTMARARYTVLLRRERFIPYKMNDTQDPGRCDFI